VVGQCFVLLLKVLQYFLLLIIDISRLPRKQTFRHCILKVVQAKLGSSVAIALYKLLWARRKKDGVDVLEHFDLLADRHHFRIQLRVFDQVSFGQDYLYVNFTRLGCIQEQDIIVFYSVQRVDEQKNLGEPCRDLNIVHDHSLPILLDFDVYVRIAYIH